MVLKKKWLRGEKGSFSLKLASVAVKIWLHHSLAIFFRFPLRFKEDRRVNLGYQSATCRCCDQKKKKELSR